MDIVLARTFLTVLSTKSFVTAAETLFVSQSAISLRIQKLEDIVGKPLLIRSKNGIEMTVHGEQFEEYARAFIQLWTEALYQTSLPDGYDSTLNLACQDSLWPELSATWVRNIEAEMATTAVRFRIEDPEVVTRSLVRGQIDIAVVYAPQIRPGLKAEHILDDQLVLVAAKSALKGGWQNNYVYGDWGPEFAIAHSRWFPELKPPQLTLAIGTSLPRFLNEAGKAAYVPYRMADDYVLQGDLVFVPGVPRFPYPAYAVWPDNTRTEKIELALEQLRRAAQTAPWIEIE
ncbi:MAG: LysR family transcriptional regulator [Ahrensia sp.]